MCILLHVVVVLLHVMLFVVWWYRLEHKVVVSSNSSAVSSAIVAISQFCALVFTTALVIVTQQLAHRDILLQRQTLTASHDQSTAWMGLGSALLVVWRQFRIPASVFGTLLVSVYLIGIAILHISTPSLFNLQIFDKPNTTVISTQIGMPIITAVDPNSEELSISPWMNIGTLLPYLARANSNSTIGVQNATLYDILDDNDGTGAVAVGAKSFNVTCGLVTNVTTAGQNSLVWNGNSYDFDTIAPHVLGNDCPSTPGHMTVLLGRNALFHIAGPTTMVDSYGNTASIVSLNPPWTFDDSGISVDNLTLIGCTLSIINQNAVVNARTKLLVSAEPDATKIQSEWQIWNPSSNLSDQDPQVDDWCNMISGMPAGQLPSLYGACINHLGELSLNPPAVCRFLDVGSMFLMDRLGLYPQFPDLDLGGITPVPLIVNLHQFENALATMTALMYWGAAYLQPDSWIKNVTGSDIGHTSVLQGQAIVSSTQTQLNINIISLAVGFSTSVILLITAFILIRRRPTVSEVGVNPTGILSIMWMAYRHPELQNKFLQVVEPTVYNLRKMGMVEVQLTDEKPATPESTDWGYHLVLNESDKLPAIPVFDTLDTSFDSEL